MKFGRISQLPDHEPPAPPRLADGDQRHHEAEDVKGEALLGGEVVAFRGQRKPAIMQALPEYLGIEAQFIAKIVAHRRDIDPCPLGDFLDRGGLVTALGEDLPGHSQERLPRVA